MMAKRTECPSKAFFLVGAPRCGTTSLAVALAQHPQICFSEPKEPHFFARLPKDFDLPRIQMEYIKTFFPVERLSRDALGEGSPACLTSRQSSLVSDQVFS